MPTTAAERYQLSSDKVQAAWTDKTRGVLLASPSNPTGTDPTRRTAPHSRGGAARGGVTMIDEIYLGLVVRGRVWPHRALASMRTSSASTASANYFNMTGWRLGWMVVPDAMVPGGRALAQNLFICASTVSQQAAWPALKPRALPNTNAAAPSSKARRDWFIPALQSLGLNVPVMPDGAFYAWADCTTQPSAWACDMQTRQLGICLELMRRAHRGHHAGARLWPRRARAVCALLHRQLHGAIARSVARLRRPA